MGKTKLKMTATLTIVMEADTELYKSGNNPNWWKPLQLKQMKRT